ncbi:hypothetical protein GS597_04170 [Synechococcales cyanobacterium C]|uniref:SPOR domain-containing protein n=1 Tax=Petrachloros mirabilis ULC683 TaxID=2781853 RepID=A0A8K2ACQ5_9CYAN|nr:hypothetical protein [Petrachloros mirabilis]NCJ05719.1 hypothetical protein [Petrachloros mirabilis ULC683]
MNTLRLDTVVPPYAQLPEVLGALDVTLESELTLFRQQRQPYAQAPLLPESVSPSHKSSETMSSALEPFLSEAPDVEAAHGESRSDGSVEADFGESEGAVAGSAELSGLDSDPDHRGLNAPEVEGGHEVDGLSEPNSLSGVSGSSLSEDVLVAGQGSVIADQRLSSNKANVPLESYLDPAIEDYLESSEALLKHMDTDESPRLREDLDELPSPWAGYRWIWAVAVGVVFGGLLLWHQMRQRGPEPRPETSEETSEVPASKANPPTVTGASSAPLSRSTTPSGPNLANREFPALNLSNLGQLSPQGETTDQATASGLFYVVVAEGGEAVTLEAARALVPDAFYTGGEIQLGAIEDEAEAQQFAESLRRQGLPAQVVTN